MSQKYAKKDVYETITNEIINGLENATDWEMPWHTAGAGLPVNIASKKRYRGVNILALMVSSMKNNFSTQTWGTYKQWQEAGCQVRKGEKATTVVFYKEFVTESETEDGEEHSEKRLWARASSVFNADQVDGYTPPAAPAPKSPAETIAEAEDFIAGIQADIRHGGGRAFFTRNGDYIQMPDLASFTGTSTSTATECYYSTLLHELTHWSGHSSRLDRTFGQRFGDAAYAMEELVAELGSAFMCASLGITPSLRPDHVNYVANWLQILKNDKTAVFKASSKASEAVTFLEQLASKSNEKSA